ncbi:KANK4 protein, partial [Columbina picui]|nr:KANK4 protein [Columbina picui]
LSANGQPPKPDGEREQPRSLPYSVETPYGFHLDLDFLKYVDDIEKGNTIRRIHIHRKAKQPKFSTLPRNFSLPENASRGCTSAPTKSWTSTCSFPQRKASLGAEETPRPLLPSELTLPLHDEPSYRRKALLAETRRQAELGAELRGRPQLLRASSLPAALPPPPGDPPGPSPLRPPPQRCHEQSGSEGAFHPTPHSPSSNGVVLNLPREASVEEGVCSGQKEHRGGGSPGLGQMQPPRQSQHPAAPQLQVVMESGGEEGDAIDAGGRSALVGDEPTSPAALQLAEENTNPGERELSVNEIAPNVLKNAGERSVQAGENKESCGPQPGDAGEPGGVAALKQQVAALEEQLSKKKEELEQVRAQWLCLEHGYPELASAIKQPASKLSSIQNQLVNSLNSLLSAYSTQGPADKENSNAQYQQLEISPTTSLKSIMKKKGYGFHAGGNGTKKNLQFVGVNGGYETTSSEDTSCEDSPSDTESETERRDEGLEPTQVKAGGESEGTSSGTSSSERCEDAGPQEPSAEAAPCAEHKDFLADCQLLSEHLSEIRTTSDKHLRHVLSTVCQEWFQVSSHKTSSPEVVAAYLKALGTIQPQLLVMVVNLADRNGNTALHYSVSHSNFQIAKLLLDTG